MSIVFPIAPASAKTLWILGILALVMVGILFLLGFSAYASQKVQFELSATELQIKGDFYGKRIPITYLSIDQAQKLDLTQRSPYQLKWRTNGVGLPGYYSGWFKLKNGEKALVWITDSKNVIYVPTTQGYSLLMSPREPDEFLASLRSI
jgi:Bacterial PH domain